MANQTFRKLHRKLSLIIFLPFLVTALTGIAFSLGESWLGLSRNITQAILKIHTGEYLGEPLVPFYVLLNGLGLIFMLVTGLSMTGLFRKKRTQPSTITDADNTTNDD